MTPARHLPRPLALLLVAPLLSATLTALPAPHATAALAAATADVDTDGDGLPDTGDGCPTVSSPNPTGCPTVTRRARLTWVKADQRLEARVTSPVTACSARARIVLWRVRPHRDFKISAVTATYSGKRRFTVHRGASYYVTVSPSYSAGVAECTKATSRTVLAPRG
ncbi:thrombospondin type 3 repeat-containing protein [Nocardioides alpinus]|nr:thrombospondin type 3 repeat-containing protein [Nocardioides alpinus]